MNKEQRKAKKAAKANKRRAKYKAEKLRTSLSKAYERSQALRLFRHDRKEQAKKNLEREMQRNQLKKDGWDEVEPYHFIRRLSTGEYQKKRI